MRAKSVREGLAHYKPPPFHIPGLLPVGGTITVHGSPGSFKSILTRNAMMQVGEGKDLWDEWRIKQPMRSFYVDVEHGEGIFLQSIKKISGAIAKFHAPANVHYVSRDYELRLDEERGFKRLVEYIEAVEPSLLVLDPWSELHGFDDVENVKQLALLRRLHSIADGMSLWIVHHDCKPGEHRHSGTAEAMRGSALWQASDTVVSIQRQDLAVQMNFSKTRHCRTPIPLYFEYDEETDTFTNTEKKVVRWQKRK